MKTIKKALSISIVLILIAGVVQASFQSFWKFNNDLVCRTDGNCDIGTAAKEIGNIFTENIDISSALNLGGVVGSGGLDMNGNGVYWDADKDTYTHSPSDDYLQTYVGGALSILDTTTGTNFDNNTLFVDKSTNRVGIGTTSPESILHIMKLTDPTFSIENSDSNMTTPNDVLGQIDFRGTDSASRVGARVGAQVDGAWGATTTDAPTRLDFYTQSDGSGDTLGSPRMTIDSSGNVGIDKTNPGAPLSFATATGKKIHLFDDIAGSRYGMGIQSFEQQFFVPSTAHFSFNKGGDIQTSGTNELMRIDAVTGNVGIGTDSPGAKLDVIGDIYARSSSGGVVGVEVNSSSGSPYIYVGESDQIQLDGTDSGGIEWSSAAENPFNIKTLNNNNDINLDPHGTGDVLIASGNVGIGDSSPDYKLEVLDTSTQLTLTYADGSTETQFFTDVNGDLHIEPSGEETMLNGSIKLSYDASNYVVLSSESDGDFNVNTARRLVIKARTNNGAGFQINSTLAQVGKWDWDGSNTQIQSNSGHVFFTNTADGQIIRFKTESLNVIDFNASQNVKVYNNLEVGGNTGIGDASPDYKLEVLAVTTQLALTYSDGIEAEMYVDSDGNLRIEPSGGKLTLDGKLKLTDKALGTPEAGMFEFYDGRMYLTNVDTQRAIDRTNDVAVETVTCANTTDETTLWTGTMEANSLSAGNVFEFHADGIVSNNSANAGDEVTIRVRVGGVEKVVLSPDTKQLTDTMWHIEANATQRTLGATGARAIHIHLAIGDPISTGDEVHAIGVATIDTTANMDVTITAEWASADVANTISLYQAYMKFKN
ncbi:MAG TPA: hypothetical protein ENG81_01130 [Candidatus Bathyarchaeota archaeon]|nr:hypothetical protein [Candidatus Bathyarchaeota archaeon]